MKSRELRARRAKLVEDARALAADRAFSKEDSIKFDRMMAESDRLKEQIDRIERAEAEEHALLEALRPVERARAGIANPRRPFDPVPAFDAYLRGGLENMSPEMRAALDVQKFHAAMGTGAGSSGGFTVPDGFYRQLISAQKAYGGMLQVANVIDSDTGNPLPIPTENDTGNTGAILSENTQVAEEPLVFGSVALGAFTYTSGLVRLSEELLQDSTFDLSGFLTRVFAERFGRVLNQHFTSGDGVAKPIGFLPEATLGVTSFDANAINSDELIDLVHSVDPAYRGAARWMMNDTTLRIIKTLRDGTGRPMWQPNLVEGEPDLLFGYPYIINQDMPAFAPASKVLAFGDFSKYFVRRITGARVLRLVERYADYNQVGFVAYQRWDGAMVDAGTHPIRFLQMHS